MILACPLASPSSALGSGGELRDGATPGRAACAQRSSAEVETVDLLAGLGRVLAEEIVADRDFPPFAGRRAMDMPCGRRMWRRLRRGSKSSARSRRAIGRTICTVGHGQAVAIMTGARCRGADAVVMVEHTIVAERSHSASEDATSGGAKFVEVQRSVSAGENFVPRGAEARAGQLLFDRGRRLDHAGIAIAASVGKSRVQVFRKPRVAMLSTGENGRD